MPGLSGWLPSVPSFSGFGSSPTAAAPAPSSSPEWPSDAGKKPPRLIYSTINPHKDTNQQPGSSEMSGMAGMEGMNN